MIYRYLQEDFIFLEDRMKHEMVIFEVLANENPEKYNFILEMAREVRASSHRFSSQVDSLVKSGKIRISDMDSLVSAYTVTMQDFQIVVGDVPGLLLFIRDLTPPFPIGYSGDYALNATVLKNQLAMVSNEVIGFLRQDVYASGYRFYPIELTNQKTDMNNITTIALSSKPIQQLPHKFIFINEIKQNGKIAENIKFEVATNSKFGEITLDSLLPANYEIQGQVRGVTPGDRYYEEDFEYHFRIIESE